MSKCQDCAKLRELLAAARAEVADLLPRLDADDMQITNLSRQLAAAEAKISSSGWVEAAEQRDIAQQRLAAAEARAMHLRLLLQNLFDHCWLAADDDRGRDAIKEVNAALANPGGEEVPS